MLTRCVLTYTTLMRALTTALIFCTLAQAAPTGEPRAAVEGLAAALEITKLGADYANSIPSEFAETTNAAAYASTDVDTETELAPTSLPMTNEEMALAEVAAVVAELATTTTEEMKAKEVAVEAELQQQHQLSRQAVDDRQQLIEQEITRAVEAVEGVESVTSSGKDLFAATTYRASFADAFGITTAATTAASIQTTTVTPTTVTESPALSELVRAAAAANEILAAALNAATMSVGNFSNTTTLKPEAATNTVDIASDGATQALSDGDKLPDANDAWQPNEIVTTNIAAATTTTGINGGAFIATTYRPTIERGVFSETTTRDAANISNEINGTDLYVKSLENEDFSVTVTKSDTAATETETEPTITTTMLYESVTSQPNALETFEIQKGADESTVSSTDISTLETTPDDMTREIPIYARTMHPISLYVRTAFEQQHQQSAASESASSTDTNNFEKEAATTTTMAATTTSEPINPAKTTSGTIHLVSTAITTTMDSFPAAITTTPMPETTTITTEETTNALAVTDNEVAESMKIFTQEAAGTTLNQISDNEVESVTTDLTAENVASASAQKNLETSTAVIANNLETRTLDNEIASANVESTTYGAAASADYEIAKVEEVKLEDGQKQSVEKASTANIDAAATTTESLETLIAVESEVRVPNKIVLATEAEATTNIPEVAASPAILVVETLEVSPSTATTTEAAITEKTTAPTTQESSIATTTTDSTATTIAEEASPAASTTKPTLIDAQTIASDAITVESDSLATALPETKTELQITTTENNAKSAEHKIIAEDEKEANTATTTTTTMAPDTAFTLPENGNQFEAVSITTTTQVATTAAEAASAVPYVSTEKTDATIPVTTAATLPTTITQNAERVHETTTDAVSTSTEVPLAPLTTTTTEVILAKLSNTETTTTNNALEALNSNENTASAQVTELPARTITTTAANEFVTTLSGSREITTTTTPNTTPADTESPVERANNVFNAATITTNSDALPQITTPTSEAGDATPETEVTAVITTTAMAEALVSAKQEEALEAAASEQPLYTSALYEQKQQQQQQQQQEPISAPTISGEFLTYTTTTSTVAETTADSIASLEDASTTTASVLTTTTMPAAYEPETISRDTTTTTTFAQDTTNIPITTARETTTLATTTTTSTTTTTTTPAPETTTTTLSPMSLIIAEHQARSLDKTPPRINRIVNEDGVEVLSGYSIVHHIHAAALAAWLAQGA